MDLKWVAVVVGLSLPTLAQSAPPAPSSSPAASLEAAERAFARTAAEKGIREAFLGVLAEEAVVFRPGPVAARRWYEERPPQPGLLAWAPQRVEVSLAGDLGYTFGPWEYRKDPKSATPDACGRYLSIWKREGGGPWRLLLDAGVGLPCSGPLTEGAAQILSPPSAAEAGAQNASASKTAPRICPLVIKRLKLAMRGIIAFQRLSYNRFDKGGLLPYTDVTS